MKEDGYDYEIGLSVDEYPKEFISEASVRYLLKTHHLLRMALKDIPRGEALLEEPLEVVVRWQILSFARNLLSRLVLFLAGDSRVTGKKYRIVGNGDGLLFFDEGTMKAFLDMTIAAVTCNGYFDDKPKNSMFSEELSILSNSAAVFFSTFDNIYDIKAIRKCRIGVEEYLQRFGTEESIAAAQNCIRRLKTMYLEITKQRELPAKKPEGDDKLKELETLIAGLADKVEKNTVTVKKLDRRQMDFLAKIKQYFTAFVKLFAPGRKAPTREALVGSMADRYQGLSHIVEPHRSQIMAVVDLTYKRPIVRKAKNKGDFSLAAAVRIVWEENHEKWEKVAGSFETYDSFKSACYNLHEKGHDPFHYSA